MCYKLAARAHIKLINRCGTGTENIARSQTFRTEIAELWGRSSQCPRMAGRSFNYNSVQRPYIVTARRTKRPASKLALGIVHFNCSQIITGFVMNDIISATQLQSVNPIQLDVASVR